jgi:hydrogenase expression/formation protein HypD
VLVHVGVAISVVDQKEAEETYSYLKQMGELDGLEPSPAAEARHEIRRRVPRCRARPSLAEAVARATTRPWTIMEICGGQTHAIVKFGLDDLLPKNLTLVHGPGCPVCVTSAELIDQAVELALRHRAILCSFGDMLRVPGNTIDLLTAKARGGDVRIVYSPLDAVTIAQENPAKQVVFFAVGFETTAPANAMSVLRAEREHVANFSILTSHVLVPPAMRAILGAADNRVQGFLAAGHVCTIMGIGEYGPIAREFNAPIIITGFEPVDILEGMLLCVRQLESGRAEVENAYSRAVKTEGNVHARRSSNRSSRSPTATGAASASSRGADSR